jgi:hypothetical protein
MAYTPPKYYENEYNGFGRLFKLGGDEVKARVVNEANTSSLVVALFLTISIPAFVSGAPSHGTDKQISAHIMLWGLSIFVQMVSLVSSVMVITVMNKCGSERAVIEVVKVIQSPGKPCLGAIAYYCGIAQWILTGISTVYTAHVNYGPSFAPCIISLSIIFFAVIVLQFSESGLAPTVWDDPVDDTPLQTRGEAHSFDEEAGLKLSSDGIPGTTL